MISFIIIIILYIFDIEIQEVKSMYFFFGKKITIMDTIKQMFCYFIIFIIKTW